MRRTIPLTLFLLLAACGTRQASSPRVSFDAEAALELVRIQTDFGPRVPGTEAHRRQLEWLESFLEPLAAVVQRQPFTAHNPFWEEDAEACNVLASFYPDKTRRILLCAHWDSRPVADQEDPPVQEPIDGAVDGAAGTAVLLQMARILSAHEPAYGVDLLFFDAEDLGVSGDYEYTYFFQGSRHFARVARETGYQPWFGILVDLIGDEPADYYKEYYSVRYAPDVVERVWSIAERLGLEQFEHREGPALVDDHWILNREARIPTINITEAAEDYPYWHTRHDTYDKVHAESIGAVGQVLAAVLYPE
ncbi:MAG: M28 family peptidase [bacterium]